MPPGEVRRLTSTNANTITTSRQEAPINKCCATLYKTIFGILCSGLGMRIGCMRRRQNNDTDPTRPRYHVRLLLHVRPHRLIELEGHASDGSKHDILPQPPPAEVAPWDRLLAHPGGDSSCR